MDTYIMNGTNSVVPMNGTNSVIPMNGTNSVVPMNGTNCVIPMQGVGGTYYVSPLALLDEDEVPMNGVPDDWEDDEIEMYRLAYMVGDPDAMQGLFKKLRGKIKQARAGNKAARDDRRTRRAERREARMAARAVRREKAARGEGFLDRVGGFLGNLGEAKRIAAEAGASLEDSGIEPDYDVLEQRAAMAAEAGASGGELRSADAGDDAGGGGGLMQMWQELPTLGKVAVVGGGLFVGYKAAQAFGLIGKKRGRK